MIITTLSKEDLSKIQYLKTENTPISDRYFFSIPYELMKRLRPNLYADVKEAILVLENDNISIECSLSPCVENNITIYWYDCYLDLKSINKLLELKELKEKEYEIPFR